MKHLLAKSTPQPEKPHGAATLRGHTALVLAAAEELLAHRGTASLAAAGLEASLEPRLRRIVLLGAAVHDLGKCSDHFQDMVRGKRRTPQLIRHEALALWLCWPGQPLTSHLLQAVQGEDELRMALACAAGHHRCFWADAVAPKDAGAGSALELLIHHEDFHHTLEMLASKLSFACPARFTQPLRVEASRRSDPCGQLGTWQEDFERRLRRNTPEARLLAVAKALVLAADVAGSALPRGEQKRAWIGEQLSQRSPPEKLFAVVDRRLRHQPLRPFQEVVAASRAPLTLVRAGCGSGKTAAAYAWAARQHPGRQVWLTYPTTGTATEGFRGYVHGADLTARLEHGRAEVDVEIFGLRQEGTPSRDEDRLDALRVWGCDVITCTVDTVLGLVQNQRKGMYAWPGLSHACLVFDEVHAYDERLFGCLLRWLEALPGLPTLLMTASLPAQRLQALRELCRRVHGLELTEVEGPADLEGLPRYQHATSKDAWAEARATLERGEKVLWVSNTVNRCLEVAAEAERRQWRALRYHSRFRYVDRVRRHGDVMEAFEAPGPVLACTTQVAEMSLDLSADLLVTDLAPVPALIQRLGRLNRRSTPQAPAPVRPFVVLDFHGPPYDEPELRQAREWLERLGPGPLSQKDLSRAWEPAPAQTRVTRLSSTWLDGLFETLPDAVREAEPNLSILRPEDAEQVRAGRARIPEVVIPMNAPPRVFAWKSWPLVGCYPVPPPGTLTYHELRGAQWQQP